MGLLLDMSPRALEKVLYFASFIVTDPGDTTLEYKQLLTDKEYREAQESFGADAFSAGMGAEAVKELLKKVDLDAECEALRQDLESSSGQKRVRAIKRMEVVEAFRKSGNKPGGSSWIASRSSRRNCAPWCRWMAAGSQPRI